MRQEKQKIHIFKGLALILIKIDTVLHSRALHMRMNKKWKSGILDQSQNL